MLQHILIKNFAVIENTEFEFEDGLNVITGETGSGKSIVVGAVSLALGSRADSSFVRFGEKKALIQLQAESDGEEYIITREIAANGKNLCKINGQIVTLGEVASLARRIADIHGQYDNQALLDPDQHIVLLDRYDQSALQPVKEAFESAYLSYKEIRSRLEQLLREERDSRKQADFYRFELEEIRRAALSPGEDSDLEERISLLQNSEKIFGAVDQACSLLDGSDLSILPGLGHIQQQISGIADYTQELQEILDSVRESYFALQDASSQLNHLRDRAVYDPAELDRCIGRLNQIEELKKKYGDSIEEILEYGNTLEFRLDAVEHFDERKATLQADAKTALSLLREKAAELTRVRKDAAEELGHAIQLELADLNFQDARLEIRVTPAPSITQDGADHVEIVISTNPGEPLKPLVKVASGGEISRIMLAIKNVTGSSDKIPTMIFDEIDAGISGLTASVVGRKLKEIARDHQVICITHLPQIAAFGDHHFRIRKESDQQKTYTSVDALDENQTVDEIARLLGGEVITDITRNNARELIRMSRKT